MSNSREAFEKWAATKFIDINRLGSGYKWEIVDGAYLGWKAALQHSGEPVALERDEYGTNHITIEPDSQGCLVYYDNAVHALPSTPQPVVPPGYVLVPTSPTEEMLDAIYDAMLGLYKAMLTDKRGE